MEAKLLISAYKPNQILDESCKELVFVGKSNIGKSSIINALLNRKNLAFVGKTPGKTRCINFYQIDETTRFVDVPGYGYAKRNRDEMIAYDDLMTAYFNRNNIVGVVMMLDAKVGPTQDDVEMQEFLKYYHFNIIYCLNKVDKCKQSDLAKTMRALKDKMNVAPHQLVQVSALNNKGINKLRALLNDKCRLNLPVEQRY